MSLTFIKAGLQTSLQDLGRQGQMHLGISNSGAMDPRSMKLANYLVGKPLNSPVFEVTLVGPVIRSESDIAIAICGAQFELAHNGNKVQCNQVVNLNKGDTLEFIRCQQGMRAYIAFTGELKIAPLMASHSTHLIANLGGLQGPIRDQQTLNISDSYHLNQKSLPKDLCPYYSGNYLIRCVPSIETSLFKSQQLNDFYQHPFQVSNEVNRMGIRLQGKAIKTNKAINITSSGLTQGSIQIPPSGLPIISSVDGQTIGGYPRIANVIAVDLPLLGQLRSQDKINFTAVSLDYADRQLAEVTQLFDRLVEYQSF